jgi:hypothetical protein
VALKRGEGQSLDVFGRLKRGVSLETASAEMDGIAARIASEHPETNEGCGRAP